MAGREKERKNEVNVALARPAYICRLLSARKSMLNLAQLPVVMANIKLNLPHSQLGLSERVVVVDER